MGLLDPIIGFGSKQRDFVNAKRAYKHRYRWAMDDMKKSGLNPILTAAGGIAGSFGNTSGSVGAGPDLQKTASNVMQFKRQKTELEGIESQTKLNKYLQLQAHEASVHHTESGRQAAAQTSLLNTQNLREALRIPGETNVRDLDKKYGTYKAGAEWISKYIAGAVPSLGLMYNPSKRSGTTSRQNPNRQNRAFQIENSPRRSP